MSYALWFLIGLVGLVLTVVFLGWPGMVVYLVAGTIGFMFATDFLFCHGEEIVDKAKKKVGG